MKAILYSLALGIGLLAFGRVEARPVRCDTCRVQDDFMREAESAGPGTHLVFNLADNVLQQWIVPGNAPGDGFAASRPREITPPLRATEELRRAHAAYVQGGGTVTPIFEAPIASLGLNPFVSDKTAHEFVMDRNMQGMIEAATGSSGVVSAMGEKNFLTALADLAKIPASPLNLRDQAAMMFKVVFKDGSHVVIRVDMDHANGRYVPDSARSPEGQKILDDMH